MPDPVQASGDFGSILRTDHSARTLEILKKHAICRHAAAAPDNQNLEILRLKMLD